MKQQVVSSYIDQPLVQNMEQKGEFVENPSPIAGKNRHGEQSGTQLWQGASVTNVP